MEAAVNTFVATSATGIPHLYEWGGMVTLLTLIVIGTCFAIFALCWIIWQMYNQNQKMFEESLRSTNSVVEAVKDLTSWVKGNKS